MQVILKEKVENLGALGEIVNIKAGYARNYLIPFGKAVKATKDSIATFEQQKQELSQQENERAALAQQRAAVLRDKTFTMSAKTGDSDKLFGSIGTKEIASAISAGVDFVVEKRQIRMPHGVIRTIGEFDLDVHLYAGVDVIVKIIVVPS